MLGLNFRKSEEQTVRGPLNPEYANGGVEPKLDDLMNDPIMDLLLSAHGLSHQWVRDHIASVKEKITQQIQVPVAA